MPRTKGPRADKVETVGELEQLAQSASGAILTEYRGLTVSEITNLRRRIRPSGGEYHVVKNTLLKRALGDHLTPEIDALLAGPTAVAFGREDIVGTTKALLDFIRELRRPDISVKGAFVEGKVLSPEQVTALSRIPPRDVVRGQAVGTMQAPLSNFVGTLNGILSEFARTLQALADKQQAPEA